MTKKTFTIIVNEIQDEKALTDISVIKQNMFKYNAQHIRGYKKISIFIKDKSNNSTKGGLSAYFQSGVMFIETVIVDKKERLRGWGTKLLEKAEEIAIENKCNCIYLDTFTFQALGFYKKLGYKTFSKLDDYDDGIVLYWMKKVLK